MSQTFDADKFLKSASPRPGVYRMLDLQDKVLYVGKAKNLKKRLTSYFRKSLDSIKTAALVDKIANVELTITHTEAEALLLEQQLIKEYRPRYNVVLRDDKSYPYIYLDDQHKFPRLGFYRGMRTGKGKFFGPYPSASSVRQTLQSLQTLFQLRQCDDAFFKNRTRPCLQYQIKNCTAPCVDYVSEQDYDKDVEHTVLFLQGKNDQIIATLADQMDQASEALNYEQAARLRDRIGGLQRIRERNYMHSESGDLDILACIAGGGHSCVQVFYIRNGRNLGNKNFFPSTPKGASEADVLGAFIGQYYLHRQSPNELLLSHKIEDQELLATALSDAAGRRVKLSASLRGERARWMKMAMTNAKSELNNRLATRAGMASRLTSLCEILDLDEAPTRMECFDISHTQGEGAVASCVVFDQEGPLKEEYRRFNIEGIEPGDDYAAIEQAVRRRYTRMLKESRPLPSLVFIDGGKGQLAKAEAVMEELQIASIKLASVAKGDARKAGLESIFLNSKAKPMTFAVDSPGLHLILQMRDEAHRFAIVGHRKKRDKRRRVSQLESIPGLGPKRRQQLYKHFGGYQGVARAGVDDLARVPGISPQLASAIYAHCHGEANLDNL